MRKKIHELLRKEFFQVLIYWELPKAGTTYKNLKLSRRSSCSSECYKDSKKCRVSFMKQVEAHLPSQTFLTVFDVFLDIQYAAVSMTTIGTEIYDNTFDYFLNGFGGF